MAATMNATVRMIDGFQLIGQANSGHGVIIDSSGEGGHASGASPMELVLMALGGCSSIDVIMILKKKRQDLRGLQVKLEAQRAESDPMVFTDVTMRYEFRGKDLNEEACRKSVELSHEKYCSVLGMVSKTAKVRFEIDIQNE